MNEKILNNLSILDLSDSDFIKFKDLIYSESGIKLNDMKKALVQARLSKRVRTLGLGSYTNYYEYLIENFESEKNDFINSITTNKTEFFRENRHFEYLTNVFLPYIESQRLNSLRIWSAGCSTGEEAYTIAITISEYFRKRPIPEVKILATDIDTNVLKKGESGIYKSELFDKIDAGIIKRYFLKGTGENSDFYMVKDDLKKMIYFRKLNLQSEKYPMKKKFHIIFCRNVIIYFDRESQVKLFKRFYNYLEDNGKLFIGHSENITNFTRDFYLEGNTIYGKNIELAGKL